MAFHLTKSNALLVEPIRCGTTWMAHALRAASIETRQPETIGDCCLRHSFPSNYAGDFAAVIVPVRHPMLWLVSFYDFFSSRPAEVWQPNRFYPQRLFGSPMPHSFEAFVRQVVEDDLASEYWDGFIDEGSSVFIRQESICRELPEALIDLGYPSEAVGRMSDIEPLNIGHPLSTWRDVPDELVAEYEDLTQWISDRFYLAAGPADTIPESE